MNTPHDPMKDWLDKHRQELDDLQPDRLLWSRIEQQLPRQRQIIPFRRVLQVAAAVAALVMAVWGGFWLGSRNKPAVMASEEMHFGLGAVSAEYAEVELYYTTSINSLLRQIDPQQLDPAVREALRQLDDEYLALQRDMGDNIDNAKVVEAMIQTYRLKLDILREIHSSLEEDATDQNEAYETMEL